MAMSLPLVLFLPHLIKLFLSWFLRLNLRCSSTSSSLHPVHIPLHFSHDLNQTQQSTSLLSVDLTTHFALCLHLNSMVFASFFRIVRSVHSKPPLFMKRKATTRAQACRRATGETLLAIHMFIKIKMLPRHLSTTGPTSHSAATAPTALRVLPARSPPPGFAVG